MGAKIYTGTGPSLSTESEFSPRNISEMMQGISTNKRENARVLMEQAKHDYQMKTLKKTENSANAIAEWASKGLDYDALTSNPMGVFGTPLPSMMANFKGYKDDMTGYGIAAHEETFSTASQSAQKRYMTQVAAQFNAISTQLQAPHGVSRGNVYKVLQKNYNADQVYANMIRAGFSPMEVSSMLEYNPKEVKQDWLPRLGRMAWEPPVEGIGGGVKIAAPAAAYGAYALGKGGIGFRSGYKELLEKAQKDWGSMKAGKFKAKYDMNKTDAGGSPGKNKKFVASKDIKKLARSKGYGSIKVPGLKAGKAALPYAAGIHLGAEGGAALTEALGGGELAQAVGGAVGGVSGAAGTKLTMTKVAKKLADPAVMKRILPVLKKIAPKLATKIAVSTTGLVIPEGASSILGAAGLLWSAYDLVQLANQAPEIYAALAGD